MHRRPISDKRQRFPSEIIADAVWLYELLRAELRFRFPLSLRLAGETLLERGVIVFSETIRSTFCAIRSHFVPPRSHRSALSTHLHRLRAMAEWKSAIVNA